MKDHHRAPIGRILSDHLDDPSPVGRAIARALLRDLHSRRTFLRRAGRGVVAAGAAWAVPGLTASRAAAQSAEPAGQLVFANWPLYIDIDEETGAYPTLERFTEETGIAVDYREDINDNAEFFGLIQPDLAAGNPTGFDLVVLSDWMIERMVRLGYLETLEHGLLPSFDANIQELYRDAWYDPGNMHSLPWQSGITGIGYDPALTGRPITTFDDLFDPAFAGRVGMFSEMIDTMCMTLLSMGVVPADATFEDATAAQEKLLTAANQGQFRAFYGNDYYDALARGDIAISMAWSGDITQMQLYDNPAVEWVLPESGGMLWVDAMAIPARAAHPVDAHLMMDFWYRVENAAPLSEYIGYFSPVKGVAEEILADAETARAEGDDEWADALERIAAGAFPDAETIANTYTYRVLSEEEERAWNDLFNEVVVG
jgi:spermidine/putrescine transport system substrate-binding protein